MALDLFVMPLWRFKAGDFRSRVEIATGLRPKIVSGGEVEELPRSPGWFACWKARRQVRSLCKVVEAENGVPIGWQDEGGVAYVEQCWGVESLRAYAHWLDCQLELPDFGPAPEGNYYNHPAWKLKSQRTSCPHLVMHDCYCGYFLPCDFSRVIEAEPFKMFGRFPTARSVGSTPRLLKDLSFVQRTLRVPEDYDYPHDDPLVDVKRAYLQMKEVADLSQRHGLPIIFWG